MSNLDKSTCIPKQACILKAYVETKTYCSYVDFGKVAHLKVIKMWAERLHKKTCQRNA